MLTFHRRFVDRDMLLRYFGGGVGHTTFVPQVGDEEVEEDLPPETGGPDLYDGPDERPDENGSPEDDDLDSSDDDSSSDGDLSKDPLDTDEAEFDLDDGGSGGDGDF